MGASPRRILRLSGSEIGPARPTIDGEAQIAASSVHRRVADVKGIVPALPGRNTVDFDELIAEVFEDLAERLSSDSMTE